MEEGPAGRSGTPAAMTLALAPSSSGTEDRLCAELLEAPEGDRSVLFVAMTGAATARVDRLPGGTGEGTATVVRVGGAATVDAAEVRSVSDPTNLTRLGIVFTEWLAETGDATPVVCLHSLDALLQYVPADRLFRFLSVLSDHLQEAGAVAHVHADPAACDDATLATLRQLFGAVVERDEPCVAE